MQVRTLPKINALITAISGAPQETNKRASDDLRTDSPCNKKIRPHHGDYFQHPQLTIADFRDVYAALKSDEADPNSTFLFDDMIATEISICAAVDTFAALEIDAGIFPDCAVDFLDHATASSITADDEVRSTFFIDEVTATALDAATQTTAAIAAPTVAVAASDVTVAATIALANAATSITAAAFAALDSNTAVSVKTAAIASTLTKITANTVIAAAESTSTTITSSLTAAVTVSATATTDTTAVATTVAATNAVINNICAKQRTLAQLSAVDREQLLNKFLLKFPFASALDKSRLKDAAEEFGQQQHVSSDTMMRLVYFREHQLSLLPQQQQQQLQDQDKKQIQQQQQQQLDFSCHRSIRNFNRACDPVLQENILFVQDVMCGQASNRDISDLYPYFFDGATAGKSTVQTAIDRLKKEQRYPMDVAADDSILSKAQQRKKKELVKQFLRREVMSVLPPKDTSTDAATTASSAVSDAATFAVVALAADTISTTMSATSSAATDAVVAVATASTNETVAGTATVVSNAASDYSDESK